MLSKKYRIFIILISIIAFFADINFAGTTGKIAGRVTDKETGEPLPGVNLVVEGTTLGSTTNLDGYYTILQVPPGIQTIIASMVGYSKVTVSNIEVHIDQTSPVDIEMTTAAIEFENITVLSERSIVKKDVSSSVSSIREDEISVLPVTSISEVASLQAGIEEGLVVRGGSADQLLFQIDGVTFRDPRNNKPISDVALTSIQEVSIERGGFNAEYGQVRSGIINIVSKEGDIKSYSGSIQMKYSAPTQKYFGISVFDPMSMWNRPYLDPAVAFIGTEAGWDEYTARQYPVFIGWDAISRGLLLDGDPTNDLTPAAAQQVWMWERRRRPTIKPDYNIDASFGGPIPIIGEALGNLRFFASYRFEKEMLLIPLSRDDYREDNFSLKLNSNLTRSMTLMLSTTTGISRNVALNATDNQFNNPAWGINGVQFWNPTDYMRTPFQIAEITNEQRPSRIFTDSWYSQANVGHWIFAGKLSDFINTKTFYEISFENVNRKYSTGPIAYRDLSKIYEVVPGHFYDEAPFGFDTLLTAGITSMF
ncbi:MAG TPA: carboxypeptidase-like regulatory domain-containing protein, partial [Ignavibacteriaceae bacterium]|nr:carboxypeptidase-like regulatory domain-containing protein [Ignavibacteriaceae bacterium]